MRFLKRRGSLASAQRACGIVATYLEFETSTPARATAATPRRPMRSKARPRNATMNIREIKVWTPAQFSGHNDQFYAEIKQERTPTESWTWKVRNAGRSLHHWDDWHFELHGKADSFDKCRDLVLKAVEHLDGLEKALDWNTAKDGL
ncbi:MAG: hypothetical protein ACYSVY_21775 [Planctomycetota bacterium]|jgi:hypothetical protein